MERRLFGAVKALARIVLAVFSCHDRSSAIMVSGAFSLLSFAMKTAIVSYIVLKRETFL